jgi:hypothetical protein
MKLELSYPYYSKLSFKGGLSAKFMEEAMISDPLSKSMLATTMQLWKKIYVCVGTIALTNPERTIIYKALIMPHICCRDPCMNSESTKFVVVTEFTSDPPNSAVLVMLAACISSTIIGGAIFFS